MATQSREWRATVAAAALAAALAVPSAPALADEGARTSGLGSLIREWFGGGTPEPSTHGLSIQKSGSPGENGRGILFHGLDHGVDPMSRDLGAGGTMRLVSPGESGQVTYFTPRVSGLRFGVASSVTREGGDAGGRTMRSDLSETRSIDLSVSQSISDFEVTASLGFADHYRETLNIGRSRSSMLTGLHVGYGGFLIGGGFRFAGPDGGARAVPRSAWGLGASFSTESLDLSAAYITARESAADAVESGEGLAVTGRYRIVPGLEARASGFYGEQKDRRTSTTRDDSVSVIGGIKLSF